MMHLVMAERRQFLIGGVGTALARASFIRIPADSRASGRLCRVFLNVVIQRGDFLFGGVGTTLARASFIRIPAYLKAGGRLRIVVYLVVVERRQFPIGSIAAPGAGVVRVPALFSAGGRFGGTGLQIMVVRIDFAGLQFAYCAGGFCNASRRAELVLTERAKFYTTKTTSHLLFAGRFILGISPMVFPHDLIACYALHSMLRLSLVF